MKDLKTYFFIAGVAHEGKDKEWMRAEDVAERITKLETFIESIAMQPKYEEINSVNFDGIYDEYGKPFVVNEYDEHIEKAKDLLWGLK